MKIYKEEHCDENREFMQICSYYYNNVSIIHPEITTIKMPFYFYFEIFYYFINYIDIEEIGKSHPDKIYYEYRGKNYSNLIIDYFNVSSTLTDIQKENFLKIASCSKLLLEENNSCFQSIDIQNKFYLLLAYYELYFYKNIRNNKKYMGSCFNLSSNYNRKRTIEKYKENSITPERFIKMTFAQRKIIIKELNNLIKEYELNETILNNDQFCLFLFDKMKTYHWDTFKNYYYLLADFYNFSTQLQKFKYFKKTNRHKQLFTEPMNYYEFIKFHKNNQITSNEINFIPIFAEKFECSIKKIAKKVDINYKKLFDKILRLTKITFTDVDVMYLQKALNEKFIFISVDIKSWITIMNSTRKPKTKKGI